MPTTLITGTSTGIGEECALRLNQMGWYVFAGVRRAEDGDALRAKAGAKDHLIAVQLDVTDHDSIQAAVQRVEEAVGERGLDGLVNNAGVAVASPLELLPVDELRRQLDINVVGQIGVTQAFLPLLRKARGRIVNIGSVSGRIAVPLLGPYCASKFALDALTGILRMELRPWHIHVAYIEPAGIATPIWSKALVEGDKIGAQLSQAAQTPYGPLIATMRQRAIKNDRSGLPVSMVSKAVAHALTSPKPKTRYPVGSTARLGELLRLLPDRLRERLIMRQFPK